MASKSQAQLAVGRGHVDLHLRRWLVAARWQAPRGPCINSA